MKKIMFIILLLAVGLAGMAAAQTPVYDIRVPDSTTIKKIESVRLNAVVDSLHRYDLGEWVKKSAYDQLAAEHKKLLDLDGKHLVESIQLLEPGILRAWQIVNDTTMAIVPKKDLPRAKKGKK